MLPAASNKNSVTAPHHHHHTQKLGMRATHACMPPLNVVGNKNICRNSDENARKLVNASCGVVRKKLQLTLWDFVVHGYSPQFIQDTRSLFYFSDRAIHIFFQISNGIVNMAIFLQISTVMAHIHTLLFLCECVYAFRPHPLGRDKLPSLIFNDNAQDTHRILWRRVRWWWYGRFANLLSMPSGGKKREKCNGMWSV